MYVCEFVPVNTDVYLRGFCATTPGSSALIRSEKGVVAPELLEEGVGEVEA